jgi:SET domain-containing protein
MNRGNTLVVKETKNYGKGVFAMKAIKNGTIVHILNGNRMDVTELVRRVNSGRENLDDPFQIGRRTYIDLDEFSRTFNHSCNPNCGIRKNSELFAIRDIFEGEQLTYDYSVTMSPTDWNMKCLCGSKNCRKTLGDISSVPKGQLAVYKRFGAIQRYMKSLLKEIESKKYRIPKYELAALKMLGSANTK